MQKIESKLIKIVKISQNIIYLFFFLLQAINKIVIIIILTMNNVSFSTVFSELVIRNVQKRVSLILFQHINNYYITPYDFLRYFARGGK